MEWSSRGNDRIVIHIKGVELERYSRMMVMMMHWRVLLIQGVFMKVRIMVRIMGYRHAIDRWNMGREVGWSFSCLVDCQSLLLVTLLKNRIRKISNVGGTHTSLVDTSFSNMSLDIVKLLVGSWVVMRNGNRLRNSKLSRLFSHFYRNGRSNSIRGLLTKLLLVHFRRWGET